MQIKPYMIIAVGGALMSIAFAQKEKTVCGPATLVGNGAAWCWAKLDASGTPVSMGVTLTETALNGLPADEPGMSHGDMPMVEYAIELPSAIKGLPYEHLMLDWNPKGHDPKPIYGVPHFDVHFYTITEEARKAITAEGPDMAKCAKAPDTAFVPAGYILPPGTIVPQMGAHWIDPTTPELSGKPFTSTFLYGSYDGKTAFLEPMIALSFLQTKPNFTQALKPMKSFDKTGYYPASYSVTYNADRHEYVISLDNLSMQQMAASK